MTSLARALSLALAQLGDPAILRVLGKSLAVTLAIFALVGWAMLRAVDWLLLRFDLDAGGLSGLIALGLWILAIWLAFRFVALAAIQFFADEVVEAVEARHYPAALTGARKVPFGEEARASLRALLRAVAANLLALPLVLLLAPTGLGGPAVLWAVNGWLLGRELQDMVWLRHKTGADTPAPLSGRARFALGGVISAMLIVPLLNLLAPVLGAAAATHLVHRRSSGLAG